MLIISDLTVLIVLFYAEISFADAEVTICKYKWLIINVYAFVLGCLK